jgi:proteic killer suppression protein
LKNNRLPNQVKNNFTNWAQDVEKKGLEEVRRRPGLHDEPIGTEGIRSVRLSDGFRACYQIIQRNGVEVLKVFSISNDHKNYCRR